jgi:hypothetical protein
MKLKNLSLVFLTLYLSANSIFAQTGDSLEKSMKHGFDTYNNGEVFKDWIKGVEELSEVGKKHSNEWLPEFWASYLYTQLARAIPKENPPKGVTIQSLLDKSQGNFDLAMKKAKNATPQVQSDFLILQSLIYDFKLGTLSNDKSKKEYQNKREEIIKQAVKLNPDSPTLKVYIATTDLLRKRDLTSVFTGRTLLVQAKREFSKREKPRYMSTDFAEEWIGFWLGQSEKGLEYLTKEK